MTIKGAHFILYVADQRRAAEFYSNTLAIEPRLNVPGMTEFEIGESAVLGLMPYASVGRLFDIDRSELGSGVEPKAELYLMVDEPSVYHKRALESGARELSPLTDRDWGHSAAYCIDNDGNVIAFACSITERA
jgi:predicted enzyme related to lactoylglutathione lyase